MTETQLTLQFPTIRRLKWTPCRFDECRFTSVTNFHEAVISRTGVWLRLDKGDIFKRGGTFNQKRNWCEKRINEYYKQAGFQPAGIWADEPKNWRDGGVA